VASAAWAVGTAGTPHNGSIPTSGPAGASTGGFGGGGFGGRNGSAAGSGRGNGGFPGGNTQGDGSPGGTGDNAQGTTGNAPGTTGNAPGGTTGNGQGGTPGNAQGGTGTTGNAQGGGFPGGGNGGGRGGFGGGQEANAEMVALLKTTGNRWAAATNGSMQAAPLQLASGRPIMAIGGFTGSDPSPTLAEFQAYVKSGAVHYYLGGGGMGGRGGGSDIAQWVEANFTATTVGGSTVYDLTKPTTS
jgi:hypothetical protein